MSAWHDACKVSDIPEGQIKVFTIDSHRIALCHVKGDEFYAVQDVCTHDDGPLGEGELINHAIECPRHGARFDIRSGRVLALPAVVPIQVYPVKVEGDTVRVEL